MIISLIILFLIIKDGLVYEFIRIISYLIGWIIAIRFTHPLGSSINQLLGTNAMLINGISFLIILIISVMILKAIGRVINHVTDFPVIHQLNALGGGFVGAIVGYVIVFLLLSICLALPSAWIQNEYLNSPVAVKIVNHTPGITSQLMNKWLR
ncbi:MAG: CvpA family protein [Acetilactobacillus jinshanensis]